MKKSLILATSLTLAPMAEAQAPAKSPLVGCIQQLGGPEEEGFPVIVGDTTVRALATIEPDGELSETDFTVMTMNYEGEQGFDDGGNGELDRVSGSDWLGHGSPTEQEQTYYRGLVRVILNECRGGQNKLIS